MPGLAAIIRVNTSFITPYVSLVVPQGASVSEAQSRVVYPDSRGRGETLERLVDELLVLAGYQFFGQLRAAFVHL